MKRQLSHLLTLGGLNDNSTSLLPPPAQPPRAEQNSLVSFLQHQTFALAQFPQLQPPCECWGPHIVQWSLSPGLGVCFFPARDLLQGREEGSECSCAPQILPCTLLCPGLPVAANRHRGKSEDKLTTVRKIELGVVVEICNPTIVEAEAGGLLTQDLSGLQNEFKINWAI